MDVPEVRLLIERSLSNHDVAVCLRVSRLWHDSFIPSLYSKATCTLLGENLHSFAKDHRLQYLRDLQVKRSTSSSARDTILRDCRGLLRLEIEIGGNFDKDYSFAARLLQQNPALHTLSFSNQALSCVDIHERLLQQLLLSCPWITALEMTHIALEGSCLKEFLVLAPKLTTLKLDNCWPSLLVETKEPFDPKDWPVFSKLRELSVKSSQSFMSWEHQLRLFECCPKLESIVWPMTRCHLGGRGNTGSTPFLVRLVDFLQRGVWPRLVSIELSVDSINSLDRPTILSDNILAQILRECPLGLRRWIVPDAHIGILVWTALQQRHFETLEVLHLSNKTESWMVQEILCTFPSLRDFRGGLLNAGELVAGVGGEVTRKTSFNTSTPYREAVLSNNAENLQESNEYVVHSSLSACVLSKSQPLSPLERRPWVCHGLQVLSIRLTRLSDTESSLQVFEQLSEMKQLEELFLCSNPISRTALGLDVRFALDFDLKTDPFQGQFKDPLSIKRHPVGGRLLKVWPRLTRCYLLR